MSRPSIPVNEIRSFSLPFLIAERRSVPGPPSPSSPPSMTTIFCSLLFNNGNSPRFSIWPPSLSCSIGGGVGPTFTTSKTSRMNLTCCMWTTHHLQYYKLYVIKRGRCQFDFCIASLCGRRRKGQELLHTQYHN